MGMRPDGIADLSRLGIAPADREKRRNTLNCSELPTLKNWKPDWKPDPADLVKLAQIKWGEVDPDNLDDVLNVQAGQWMEPFILAWGERQLGVRMSGRGEKHHAARRPWMACTLDGRIDDYHGRGTWVVQTKFFSPFYPIASAIEDKRAQVLGEMYCTGAAGTLLLVYNQGNKLEAYEFEADPAPLAELLEACDDFWAAVQDKRLPAVLPPKLGKSATVPPVRVGEWDVSRSPKANEWAALAADFLANRDANAKFVAAHDGLKAIAPKDKFRAHGNGVEVTVSKSGAKTVRAIETKDAA